MTVKELERELERLAVADMDSGQLDAAVMKLGQLAAIELMAEDAAREPSTAEARAAAIDELWSDAVERAREHAQADLEEAPAQLDPDVEAVASGRPAVLLPLAGLGVLIVALLLIVGAGRAFESVASGVDRSAQSGTAASSAVASPEPLSTSTRVPRPTAVPRTSVAAPAEGGTADDANDAGCVDESGAPLPASSWLCRGRAIRGSAGGGSGPPPPDTVAESVVPPYETVNTMRLGMPKRVRYEVNVVVPPSYSREELVAVLTDAVRKTMRQKGDARAVGVFVYGSRSSLGTGWDRGRALASVDGQGWTGDRTFAPVAPSLRDQGRIYLTLGTALASGEAIEVDR